jgi:hypothetical protein
VNAFPSPELRKKILDQVVGRALALEAIEQIDYHEGSTPEVVAHVRLLGDESATVSLQLTCDGDYIVVASCLTQLRYSFPHTWAWHHFNDTGCLLN